MKLSFTDYRTFMRLVCRVLDKGITDGERESIVQMVTALNEGLDIKHEDFEELESICRAYGVRRCRHDRWTSHYTRPRGKTLAEGRRWMLQMAFTYLGMGSVDIWLEQQAQLVQGVDYFAPYRDSSVIVADSRNRQTVRSQAV